MFTAPRLFMTVTPSGIALHSDDPRHWPLPLVHDRQSLTRAVLDFAEAQRVDPRSILFITGADVAHPEAITSDLDVFDLCGTVRAMQWTVDYGPLRAA